MTMEIPMQEIIPPSPAPEEEDISDSDMSGLSSEDDGEMEPTPVALPKTTAAPKKKPAVKKPTVKVKKSPAARRPLIVKVKKSRTVRRPYKSMEQGKLEDKQSVAQTRFDVARKRLDVIQSQLTRFDHEIETRASMPPVIEEEEVPAAL